MKHLHVVDEFGKKLTTTCGSGRIIIKTEIEKTRIAGKKGTKECEVLLKTWFEDNLKQAHFTQQKYFLFNKEESSIFINDGIDNGYYKKEKINQSYSKIVVSLLNKNGVPIDLKAIEFESCKDTFDRLNLPCLKNEIYIHKAKCKPIGQDFIEANKRMVLLIELDLTDTIECKGMVSIKCTPSQSGIIRTLNGSASQKDISIDSLIKNSSYKEQAFLHFEVIDTAVKDFKFDIELTQNEILPSGFKQSTIINKRESDACIINKSETRYGK